MTGENFLRLERGTKVKELKAKINKLRNECGEMCSVNNITENGFDDVKYDTLCKRIEWLEYLLWGITEN